MAARFGSSPLPATPRCACVCRTPARASRQNNWSWFSSPFSRPSPVLCGRPAARAWGWRSVGGSSSRMAAGSGRNRLAPDAAAHSPSHCRYGWTTMSSAPDAGRRAAGTGGRREVGAGRAERDRRKSRLPLVLVVDDDASLRRFVRRSLELSDFRVLEAQDGATALDLACTEGLAMILLDINLPAMDGLTVCKRVREFSSVPIMMITALGREEQIVRGLDAG